MPTTRHSIGQLEGLGGLFLAVKGTASGAAGAAISINSSTGISGPAAMIADVTIVRNSAGNHTLTINPFRGPQGTLFHSVTAQSNNTAVGVSTTFAYTNDSCAVTIAMFATSNGTTIDADFSAVLWAL